MNIQQIIQQKASQILPRLLEIRNHLHENPELSFYEYKTSEFIQAELKKMKIPFMSFSGTGIIAEIVGEANYSEKTVGLRAELDALPIQETNKNPNASKNSGVMHACGHDVHMSCLLGAAQILSEIKSAWAGKIILIFQPGEEKLPGGASVMIADGLFEKHPLDCIIAQHVAPEIEVGSVGFRPGKYMASSDELYINIIGKGGHGALPHKTIDPVVVSAHIILALQQINSRFSDPLIPSVLTIGRVEALGATNVIPEKVFLQGTFRTLDETWRDQAHKLIYDICTNTAKAFGANVDIQIKHGYPCLYNHEKFTQQCITWAEKINHNIIALDYRMTSEDFAYYSKHVPVCFYRLGVKSSDGQIKQLHTSEFNIDVHALKYGTEMMSWLAYNALKDL